jgi:hypothetical protein
VGWGGGGYKNAESRDILRRFEQFLSFSCFYCEDSSYPSKVEAGRLRIDVNLSWFGIQLPVGDTSTQGILVPPLRILTAFHHRLCMHVGNEYDIVPIKNIVNL